MKWWDGHQLDGRDAQAGDVVQDRGVGHAGVGAPQLSRDLGVVDGQAPHVGFVDDRVVPFGPGAAVVGPLERRVAHDGQGHAGRRVGLVGHQVVTPQGVPVGGLAPLNGPADRFGIGVEQQLVGVAAQPGLRVEGAVNPVAVAGSGLQPLQVAVPAVGVDLGEQVALLLAVIVEQAQLDGFGQLGVDGKVGPQPVVGRTEGKGLAGCNSIQHGG